MVVLVWVGVVDVIAQLRGDAVRHAGSGASRVMVTGTTMPLSGAKSPRLVTSG